MAKILNDTFTSVFTEEDTNNIPTTEHLFNDTEDLSSLVITIEIVHKKLEVLDPCKSPGPDQIYPTCKRTS